MTGIIIVIYCLEDQGTGLLSRTINFVFAEESMALSLFMQNAISENRGVILVGVQSTLGPQKNDGSESHPKEKFLYDNKANT